MTGMETATPLTLAALTALTPTVTVIVALLISRSDLREGLAKVNATMDRLDERLNGKMDKLDERLSARMDKLSARMDKLGADYTEFYGLQKKLEGGVGEISKR